MWSVADRAFVGVSDGAVYRTATPVQAGDYSLVAKSSFEVDDKTGYSIYYPLDPSEYIKVHSRDTIGQPQYLSTFVADTLVLL